MSELHFAKPRKRTSSEVEKTHVSFDIVNDLNDIISQQTPYINTKDSASMEAQALLSGAICSTSPFPINDDFWTSLDMFNDNGHGVTASSAPQHLKDDIQEMDFALTKVVSKDEPFNDLGDLSDMWPFGGDDEMDASSTTDDLFGPDLADSTAKDIDTIKSDLMWSSTLDKDTTLGSGLDSAPLNRRRRRDVSITLSECAEGLLTVKDMELMSTSPLLGSSPMIGNHGTHNAFFMETPLASSESDTETGISGDSDEEEIDVVNHQEQEPEPLSSSRTRIHYRKHHSSHHHKQHHNYKNGSNGLNIQPGRSLLKSRHNQHQQQHQVTIKQDKDQEQKSSTHPIDHMFGDHSYFLVRPAPGSTGSDGKDASDFYSDEESRDNDENRNTFGGMLTPTESGDEAEDRLKGNVTSTTLTTPVNIDKRKIAQAVQNLIQNRSSHASDGKTAKAAANALLGQKSSEVKFRFRMRFKSNTPQQQKQQQKSLLNVNNKPIYNINNQQPEHRMKRKSATKNLHCPAPQEDEPTANIHSIATATATMLTAPTTNRHQQMSPYYISTSATSTPIQQHQLQINHPSSTSNKNSSSISMGSSSRKSLLNNNNSGNKLSQEDKCREIRDLHNSMERQRRVDLRKNFDMLKVCVPELADNDKASKLNILNKAADYCRLLVSLDAKFKKE